MHRFYGEAVGGTDADTYPLGGSDTRNPAELPHDFEDSCLADTDISPKQKTLVYVKFPFGISYTPLENVVI